MKIIEVTNCFGCPYTDHYHGVGITEFCTKLKDRVISKGGEIFEDCPLIEASPEVKTLHVEKQKLQAILQEGEKNMQIQRDSMVRTINEMFT